MTHLLFRAVVAAVALLAIAVSARGQSPLAIGFEEAFTPDFEQRDLPVFRSELILDDGQVAVVETLFADYQEQFDQAMMEVRSDMRDVQALLGTEDPEIDRRREELREQISQLFEQMTEDLENLPQGSSPNEIRKRYEDKVKEIQRDLESLRTQPMDAARMRKVFDDASARLAAWNQQKRQLGEKFTGDVQTVLSEEQRVRWPVLDRRLRREKTISDGRLQGERVDLIALTTEMKLDGPSQQAIAQTMQDYAARLDAALRARNDGTQAVQPQMFQAVRDGDRTALQRALEQLSNWHVAVRNVNDETAQMIVAALPNNADGSGAGAQFLAQFQQRGYPQVFRSTQALRLLKAAQEVPGLTADQLHAIHSMQAQFDMELAPVSERLLQTVREHEPKQYQLREERRLMPPGRDQEETERDRGADPIQEAFAKRNEMGAKYATQLEALLGPDLYERLPRGRGTVETPGEDDSDD